MRAGLIQAFGCALNMLPDSLKKLFRRNRVNFILMSIGIVVYVAISVIGIYDNNDTLIKKDLEKEFDQIEHLPDAEPVHSSSAFVSHGYLALVSNRYRTILSLSRNPLLL